MGGGSRCGTDEATGFSGTSPFAVATPASPQGPRLPQFLPWEQEALRFLGPPPPLPWGASTQY